MNGNYCNIYVWVRAKTGDPVAGSGKSPADAAISKWLYLMGFELPVPYLSKPEDSRRNAAGPKEKCIVI